VFEKLQLNSYFAFILLRRLFVLQQVLEVDPVRSSGKIIRSEPYFSELGFHFTRLFRLHLAVCSTGSEIFTDYFGRTLCILLPAEKKCKSEKILCIKFYFSANSEETKLINFSGVTAESIRVALV